MKRQAGADGRFWAVVLCWFGMMAGGRRAAKASRILEEARRIELGSRVYNPNHDHYHSHVERTIVLQS